MIDSAGTRNPSLLIVHAHVIDRLSTELQPASHEKSRVD